MNSKALSLSLIMAAIAVFFVQSYVTSVEDEAKKRYGSDVLVLKAKSDIKEQSTIEENMLGFEIMPERFLEPNAIYFNKKQEDEDSKRTLKTIVGSVAMVSMQKGEQVTASKISDLGVRTGLAPQVTPGHRAVSIPVSEFGSASKLIKPGDRVDVIGIMEIGGGGGGGKDNKVAKTILQDVLILSTGKNVTRNDARILEPDSFGGKSKVRSLVEDTTFSTVTLEVEPAQAQMIALMVGADMPMILALRNNDDTDRVDLGGVNIADVLGGDAAKSGRSPARK